MRYQRHCFSFSQAAFAADSDIADGQTQRFDFSILQSMAHDLAQTAWRGAPRPLPDTLATMTPQAYNSIQYDAEKSLWHNVENRQLDAQFFHMGMGFRRRVRMFLLIPQHIWRVKFTFARSCSNTTMRVLIPNN